MRIYSMTATFGKLENQTLTLEPGLNVISAPNEWGKSTWCTFLATMLYGLDTREKTTKASLSVKEHYAPWSGAPMAGRIDAHWQGRDITIERWTKGRTPLGEFRAYETQTGLPIPELTGTTCGQTLLGVEKSVFLRAGFLRLSDLPVTQDESLRRRLNALVTTGDESGAGDELAQKLKELKNKCRFNRTGLIPQAQEQKRELEATLAELQTLQLQTRVLKQNMTDWEQQALALENHRQALRYAAARENMVRVEVANAAAAEAERQYQQLQAQCQNLPDLNQARETADTLRALHHRTMALDLEHQMLPPAPQPPASACASDGLAQVQAHSTWLQELLQAQAAAKKLQKIACIPLIAAIPLAVVVGLLSQSIPVAVLAAAVMLIGGFAMMAVANGRMRDIPGHLRTLETLYGSLDPQQWLRRAEAATQAQANYEAALSQHRQTLAAFHAKRDALTAQITHLTQGQPLEQCLQNWQAVSHKWEQLAQAQQAHNDALAHALALQAMLKPVAKPEMADELTLDEAETLRMADSTAFQLRQGQLRLGQLQGRMDALGDENALRHQLREVELRLEKLEKTYAALELAQQTLANASEQLQRRFAPRIAEQARELFGRLTGGRYDRLNLTQELSVDTATTEDIAIRSAQWRSEGTVDQLYLALRLAVARELTPNAPLVLDDALVRFDDVRHAAAMEILRQEAQRKQVILFTCQSREC